MMWSVSLPSLTSLSVGGCFSPLFIHSTHFLFCHSFRLPEEMLEDFLASLGSLITSQTLTLMPLRQIYLGATFPIMPLGPS